MVLTSVTNLLSVDFTNTAIPLVVPSSSMLNRLYSLLLCSGGILAEFWLDLFDHGDVSVILVHKELMRPSNHLAAILRSHDNWGEMWPDVSGPPNYHF